MRRRPYGDHYDGAETLAASPVARLSWKRLSRFYRLRIAIPRKLSTLAAASCSVGSIVCMCLFFWSTRRTVDLEMLPAATQHATAVRQGTQTDLEYSLHNRASVPIRIIAMTTSCACSGVELAKKELASGESVPFVVKFSSGGLRGTVSLGATIAYQKNDEKRLRFFRVRTKVEIDPEYGVDPERIKFGDNRPLHQRVVLTPRHIPDLRIDSAVCNLRFFTATVLPQGTGRQQVVEVAFLPAEYYNDAGFGELRVYTDSVRQPVLVVPIDVNWSARGTGETVQPQGIKP